MISNESLEILKTLNSCGKVDVSSKDRYSLKQLRDNALITYRLSSSEDSSGHRSICWKDIQITEDGKAYLQRVESENQSVQEQISILREMADASKQRLALYEEELASQKKGLSAQQQELTIAERNLDLHEKELDAQKNQLTIAERNLATHKDELNAQKQELIISKRNLALYKQQLEDARKDTAEAAKRGWIAIWISVISIAVSIAISVLNSGWIK